MSPQKSRRSVCNLRIGPLVGERWFRKFCNPSISPASTPGTMPRTNSMAPKTIAVIAGFAMLPASYQRPRLIGKSCSSAATLQLSVVRLARNISHADRLRTLPDIGYLAAEAVRPRLGAWLSNFGDLSSSRNTYDERMSTASGKSAFCECFRVALQ